MRNAKEVHAESDSACLQDFHSIYVVFLRVHAHLNAIGSYFLPQFFEVMVQKPFIFPERKNAQE